MQKPESDSRDSKAPQSGPLEAALASEATLSALLDALPVGVVVVDAGGRLLRSNTAHRDLWGISPQTTGWQEYNQWVGWNSSTGERIQAHEWAMARALLTGEIVRGELVECQPFHGGSRRLFLNSAAPVRDAAGRIIGGVVAELDVTERRENAVELERLLLAQRNARHRTEQLQALTAALSAARSSEEIAKATLEVGSRVIGSTRGSVYRSIEEDGVAVAFELVAAIGYSQATVQQWRLHSASIGTPGAEAARTRQPVVIDRSELLERYSAATETVESENIGSTAAFPLLSHLTHGATAVLGFVTFDFDSESPLTESEAQYLGALAQLCSQALERARLSDADRDTRQQLESVLGAISDGFFTLDRDWRFSYVNERTERLFGMQRERLLGRSMWDVFPLLLGTPFEQHYRHVMECREPVNFETFYAPAASWTEARAFPTPQGIAVYFQDVTARQEADERLRASEAKLQAIFEAAPVGLYFAEAPDGRIVKANQRVEDIAGHPVPSSKNMQANPQDYVGYHEDGRRMEPDEYPIVRVLRGDPHVELEFLYVRADGRRAWLRSIGVPIRDGDGNITAGLVATIDIDRERRAIAALEKLTTELQQTQMRLDVALDAGRMGVWHWNPVKREAHWNRQMFAILGLPAREDGLSQGDAFLSRIHPEDRPVVEAAFAKSLADGAPFEIEMRLMCADGQVRWLLSRAKVIADEGGTPVSMMGVNVDITQQKRTEQALLEADRRRNEFLAMLGHELRNPLAPIANAARLLGKRELRQEQHDKAVQIIRRQSAHLARLVDDLLEVSRVTQGRIELRKENILAIAAILSAAETVRPLMREQAQELEIDVPTDVHLLADPARLTQIVANLLGNAAKYTQRGGHVTVRGRVIDDAWFEIAVTDNGAGIEPELLPRIFDMFSQGAATMDRSRGGLGLGLALVKRLVDLHGGSIRAESAGLGKGSAFIVRLPLPQAQQKLSETADASSADMRPTSILVVDDNADAALSLATLLEADGHEVHVAHDGREALEQAHTVRPEVVLLDLGLPKIDGYSVARQLRSDAELADTIIIAISGYGQAPDVEKAKRAGFDAHLLKPAELEAIYAAMQKNRLDQRRAQH